MQLHLAFHVAEVLTIVYLIIAQHQTKHMLLYLAKTITSVNDHLDVLISLTKPAKDGDIKCRDADDFLFVDKKFFTD